MQNQILILFCINTFSAIGYSLIAPLYPMIAREKGVTEFIVGLIFSSFAVSNVLIIPIIPKLVTLIGKRKLFLYAVIIEVNY